MTLQPAAALLGTASRDDQLPHRGPTWHTRAVKTLLCPRPGVVAKAAEGCADAMCPCWDRLFQTITCDLTHPEQVELFFSW